MIERDIHWIMRSMKQLFIEQRDERNSHSFNNQMNFLKLVIFVCFFFQFNVNFRLQFVFSFLKIQTVKLFWVTKSSLALLVRCHKKSLITTRRISEDKIGECWKEDKWDVKTFPSQ